MYSVGFFRKSALENTKFQSIEFGATAQLPENVVRCVASHMSSSSVESSLGCQKKNSRGFFLFL